MRPRELCYQRQHNIIRSRLNAGEPGCPDCHWVRCRRKEGCGWMRRVLQQRLVLQRLRLTQRHSKQASARLPGGC